MKNEEIKFSIPKVYSNLKELYIEHNTLCRGAHFHTEIEVVFVKSGSILCHFEKGSIRISENKMIVISSNVIHHLTYDNTPAQICYLQIDTAKMMKIMYSEFSNVPLIFHNRLKQYELFSKDTPIYSLLQTILYELMAQKPYYETVAMGGLIQLIAYLQRENIVPDFHAFSQNSSFLKILPVILYANEHFFEKVYLDDVCNTLYLDKFYFCKIFKKTTGITFFQYLTNIRLQNAEKLLVTTNKTITKIAEECGFSTVQYFHSVFSKWKGCSPSLYRNTYYKNSTV